MKKNLEKKHKASIIDILDLVQSEDFYLAGGTAVYYHLEHRVSEDLDFFTEKRVDFEKYLPLLKNHTVTFLSSNTIHCEVKNVKVSFFYYPYKLLAPLIDFDMIKVASLKDIMCMKILSIIQRGSKKDFVDLFFILRELEIERDKIVELFMEKFGKYNELVIYKGLTFFDDAENEPELRLKKTIKWKAIKEFFVQNFGNIPQDKKLKSP